MDILASFKNLFFERDVAGDYWYTIGSGNTAWSLGNKTEALLNNPVTFACVDLLADLFSQFKPLINGEEADNHWIVKMLNNPNRWQSKQDFLKEYTYFKTGEGWVAQMPIKGVGIKEPSAIYNLNPANVCYNKNFPTRLIFEKEDLKSIDMMQFKYNELHQKKEFNINDAIFFFDIANGLTEDFLLKSPSRLIPIQKNIRNINAALDAKYQGITKTGRFIVSGSTKGNLTQRPLDANEKKDIEKALGKFGLGNASGDIAVTNSQVEVHELSVALKNLGLDDSVAADALMIINVFRTPLELFPISTSGSTYENQKTATINYIQNVVQNHVDDYCNSLNSFFGLGDELSGTLEHLSVMQYIEDMKADKALKVSASIRNLTGTNINPDEFLESMGINIERNG